MPFWQFLRNWLIGWIGHALLVLCKNKMNTFYNLKLQNRFYTSTLLNWVKRERLSPKERPFPTIKITQLLARDRQFREHLRFKAEYSYVNWDQFCFARTSWINPNFYSLKLQNRSYTSTLLNWVKRERLSPKERPFPTIKITQLLARDRQFREHLRFKAEYSYVNWDQFCFARTSWIHPNFYSLTLYSLDSIHCAIYVVYNNVYVCM